MTLTLDAFRALGLFVREDMVGPADRQRLLDACRGQAGDAAAVMTPAQGSLVRSDVRTAFELDLPPDAAADLRSRIDALRGELGSHFCVALGESEGLVPLRYPEGAFYRSHRDRAAAGDGSRRAVSVVLFLNGGDGSPGVAFAGGDLRFHGLVEAEDLDESGVDLVPHAGTLVAFPSTLLHEVTPVRRGERYSIVTWFGEAATRRS
jgi:predicted 2-oxoglutarate/Fe(II)-dependent dioxygenase YbiX